ncbi:hypothetical protein QR685DRAFT_530825 [Neurospora intermedia]|uniref:Secreted protein n=1 Tax=Neurospora intermedia TaxID=5142 RepID=A0ABR3D7P6_NEUIN
MSIMLLLVFFLFGIRIDARQSQPHYPTVPVLFVLSSKMPWSPSKTTFAVRTERWPVARTSGPLLDMKSSQHIASWTTEIASVTDVQDGDLGILASPRLPRLPVSRLLNGIIELQQAHTTIPTGKLGIPSALP